MGCVIFLDREGWEADTTVLSTQRRVLLHSCQSGCGIPGVRRLGGCSLGVPGAVRHCLVQRTTTARYTKIQWRWHADVTVSAEDRWRTQGSEMSTDLLWS